MKMEQYMTRDFTRPLVAGLAVLLCSGAAHAAQVVPNTGFEAPDNLTGWLQFPLGGTIGLVNDNGPSAPGTQAGLLSANASGGASCPQIKVERLAAGLLTNGAPVTISFDAKSTLQTQDINAGPFAGNVVFIAEFFTELTGDNGAVNQILLGPPTFLTQEWQTFTYNTFLSADAGGGLSLLFKADCGGTPTCRFDALIDNVTIDTAVVPAPAAVWLLGTGLLGLIGRNVVRRRTAA